MFTELTKLLNKRVSLANQLKLKRTRKVDLTLESKITSLLKDVESDFTQIRRMQIWCKEEISLHQRQVIDSCCSSIKERSCKALSSFN